MRVNTSRHTVKHLAHEARTKGSTRTNLAGEGIVGCLKPVELHMFGYPDQVTTALGIETDWPVAQLVDVRCRKCENCLRARAQLWTARAMDETKVATRTWFGTLTLTPDRQTWARYSAIKALGGPPVDADSVFRESVRIVGAETTRFLKRVRKTNSFRYLLVAEQHKSGLPHFHILIHEYAAPLTKRLLEDQWKFGFSHWRLVEPGNERAAGYVCKYLAKSALARVRASGDYGRGGHIRLFTERVLAATRRIAAETTCLSEMSTGAPEE